MPKQICYVGIDRKLRGLSRFIADVILFFITVIRESHDNTGLITAYILPYSISNG
jgi:hypothetical protein